MYVTIPLLPSVTNLGAKIDNRCDMEKHALKMCTNACFHLQSICKIRRCLTMESYKIPNSQVRRHFQATSPEETIPELVYLIPRIGQSLI